MRKKLLRCLAGFILAGMMMGILSGCTAQGSRNLPTVELLAYTKGEGDSWCTRELSVDLQTGKMDLHPETLYEIENEVGWSHELFPIVALPDLLILRGEPAVPPERAYIVSAKENEIWNQEYKLEYQPESAQAILKKNAQTIGVVDDLVYDGLAMIPIAFYLDQEDSLVVMCQRGTEETPWNEIYPVSFVAVRDEQDSEHFIAQQIYSYEDMFSEQLVKIRMPEYVWFGTNIYGVAEQEAFFWNEGRSIVKIDPYAGSHHVILQKEDIERDKKDLDTDTEGYVFFNDFSVQNGIYIALFLNYNDVAGTYAVFYDGEKNFLGSLLCRDGEALIYFDRDDQERCRIEEKGLWPFLYGA